MTADPLHRLTAGLAEEERAARLSQRPDWAATPEGSVWDSEGWVADVAGDLNAHVARQDPRATLDRVEAIRGPVEVYRVKAAELEAAVHDADQTYAAYSEGYRDACLMFVRALASIYPEDTDARETP